MEIREIGLGLCFMRTNLIRIVGWPGCGFRTGTGMGVG